MAYYMMYEDKKGKYEVIDITKSIIFTKESKYTKVGACSLKEIDLFTSMFNNSNELKKQLLVEGLIDNDQANKNISGKKQGTDFIEKKPSLIVTLWLNKKTRNFNDYINSPNVSNLLLEVIKNDINNFNIIEEALEYFNEYFNNTIKQIKFLEKNHLVINKNQLLSLKNYLSSIRYKVSQFI